MKTIAEIRQALAAKVAEVKAIDATDASALERGTAEVNALVAELNAANAIEAAEQRAAEQKLADLQKEAGRKFSIVKFLREVSKGQLTGLEAEVAELGAQEYQRLGLAQNGFVIPTAYLRSAQGQNAGVAAEGKNLVETMPAKYVDMLKSKLVLAGLGATVLTDLNGELPVLTSQQISASWGAEAALAPTVRAAYARAIMKPHRNMVNVVVTKDLLRQTSFDVEADLLDKIITAHANCVEAAAIYGGGTDEPVGIFANNNIPVVAMGTNGAAISWKKVVELESEVNSNNADRGRLAYLTNAKVMGELKTTQKASGIGFIYENGVVNGYKADYSNFVPANLTKGTSASKCHGMVFGNFADLYIGEWGGIDIVVDPYTSKKTGEIEICLNAWNDAVVAEPKSFAVIKDITI